MSSRLPTEYLVVGAGATGMAFADALVDHSDARVTIVDRRHGAGGHWLVAYPFVRLHQASAFYGVASTLLGGGQIQQRGPEAGLQERATRSEVCAYYDRVLDRLQASDRVEFMPATEYVGGRTVVSQVSGSAREFPATCRVVDAHHLEPVVPAESPPPFDVAEDARAMSVDAVVRVTEPPRQWVVVGSGKTATDCVIWLLGQGVDVDRICWVRPRDPWMLNRAVVQPDPAVIHGMVADIMESATAAPTLDALFLELEQRGVMLRIDRTTLPTMARTPTLAGWELDLLRGVDDVLRRGHLRRVERGVLHFDDGAVAIDHDAVVVHCAGAGLRHPPLVRVWQPERITLQPIRSGFPCFGAALVGYVEATRVDEAAKNRLCPPCPYPNSLAQWAEMTVRGARNAASFGAEPDIAAWANRVPLNPAAIPSGRPRTEALGEAQDRLQRHGPPGMAALARLAGG